MLISKIVKKEEITEKEQEEMFKLMNTFYSNMKYDNFIRDLDEKDYSILLFSQERLVGFSTQKILKLPNEVIGVFSGDTIIHSDYWGSIELYRTFARFFVELGEQYSDFYWFLISKGYKTYKMLPLFFREFYPNYRKAVPANLKEIMHSFGESRYPGEYCRDSGVIKYKGIKDSLKTGVADIEKKHLKDRDIRFFLENNPDYQRGNDLVCITSLTKENLKPRIKKMLLGE